jgi:hypothetical protein
MTHDIQPRPQAASLRPAAGATAYRPNPDPRRHSHPVADRFGQVVTRQQVDHYIDNEGGAAGGGAALGATSKIRVFRPTPSQSVSCRHR